MTNKLPARRSQGTQDRILDAARKLFAETGFDKTTVRAVAAQASIHPSLVMRYFVSKEGLFAASMHFNLHLPDLTLVPKARRGETLAKHFLARWEDEENGDELPALLRIASTHPDGRQQLLNIFEEQLAPALMAVTPKKRAGVIVPLIATQAIGLAFTRYVLKLPAVVALPSTVIATCIGATFQAYLDLA